MRATVLSYQAECDRIWALADRVFAPYAMYRREAAKVNRTSSTRCAKARS
jgi:hypothetical protein